MSIIAYNQSMLEKNKNIIFYAVLGFLLLTGIVLRILFYSYARPFWNDEAALALNLTDRTFLGLFLPLSHEQVTPPLYSVLCKLCGYFIPKAEYAFRLPALFCGILSVPLFFLLAQKVVKNRVGTVFASALFALNYQLIYYSQELKQYCADVLCFLCILISYFYLDFDKLKKKQLIVISLFFAVSVWFSYTSVFALFVLGLLLLVKNKKLLPYIFAAPAVSCALLGVFVTRFASDNTLHVFWKDGFIAKNFSNFFNLIHNNMIFYFPDLSWKLLIILMFIAGSVVLFKSIKSEKSLLLAVPVVLALAMSYFNIYPLYTRTAIYLLPVVVLIMAKTFDLNVFSKKSAGLVVSILLTAVFAIFSFKTDFVQILQKKYYRETTPQLLSLFKSTAKDSAMLIVPHLSAINYEYYSKNAGIDPKKVILVKFELYEYEQIKTVYDTLPKGITYYILLTHSGDKALELKNLKAYAASQKQFDITADEFDNALISFNR